MPNFLHRFLSQVNRCILIFIPVKFIVCLYLFDKICYIEMQFSKQEGVRTYEIFEKSNGNKSIGK